MVKYFEEWQDLKKVIRQCYNRHQSSLHGAKKDSITIVRGIPFLEVALEKIDLLINHYGKRSTKNKYKDELMVFFIDLRSSMRMMVRKTIDFSIEDLVKGQNYPIGVLFKLSNTFVHNSSILDVVNQNLVKTFDVNYILKINIQKKINEDEVGNVLSKNQDKLSYVPQTGEAEGKKIRDYHKILLFTIEKDKTDVITQHKYCGVYEFNRRNFTETGQLKNIEFTKTNSYASERSSRDQNEDIITNSQIKNSDSIVYWEKLQEKVEMMKNRMQKEEIKSNADKLLRRRAGEKWFSMMDNYKKWLETIKISNPDLWKKFEDHNAEPKWLNELGESNYSCDFVIVGDVNGYGKVVLCYVDIKTTVDTITNFYISVSELAKWRECNKVQNDRSNINNYFKPIYMVVNLLCWNKDENHENQNDIVFKTYFDINNPALEFTEGKVELK